MGHRARDVYLNDHLAGSTMGVNLARRLARRAQGTPLGETMQPIADEIARDRATLEDLMARLGTSANPVKRGVTWLAEKAAALRFSGATTRDPRLGTFLALETLSLGIEGKRCLWQALAAAADGTPELAGFDFDDLARRAERQRAAVERERLAWAAAVAGR